MNDSFGKYNKLGIKRVKKQKLISVWQFEDAWAFDLGWSNY